MKDDRHIAINDAWNWGRFGIQLTFGSVSVLQAESARGKSRGKYGKARGHIPILAVANKQQEAQLSQRKQRVSWFQLTHPCLSLTSHLQGTSVNNRTNVLSPETILFKSESVESSEGLHISLPCNYFGHIATKSTKSLRFRAWLYLSQF